MAVKKGMMPTPAVPLEKNPGKGGGPLPPPLAKGKPKKGNLPKGTGIKRY